MQFALDEHLVLLLRRHAVLGEHHVVEEGAQIATGGGNGLLVLNLGLRRALVILQVARELDSLYRHPHVVILPKRRLHDAVLYAGRAVDAD